ncbi:MAG: hypothetical protein HY898_31185 [Deltaproteobacteria bacterium]|nr:hypothetical protein [Deltaproteobacteria bacterium]
MNRILPWAAAATLIGGSGQAVAQVEGGPKFPVQGWYLPVGLNVGGAFHHESRGMILGAETSVAYYRRGWWMGVYTDVLRDFGNDRTRWSVGPELGFSFVGIDGGFLTQLGEDKVYTGYQIRGLVTMSLLSLYGRGGWLPSHPSEQGFAEVGVLLKIPIPLWEEGHLPRYYPQPTARAPLHPD